MGTSRWRCCLDEVAYDVNSMRLVLSTALLLLLSVLLALLLLLLPLTAAALRGQDTPGGLVDLSMLRCKQADGPGKLFPGYGCSCHARFRHAEHRGDGLDSCCTVAHCCARAAVLNHCQSGSGLRTLQARLKGRPSCKWKQPTPLGKRGLRSEAVVASGATTAEAPEAMVPEPAAVVEVSREKRTPAVERANGVTCERALDKCERALYRCARGAKVMSDLVGLSPDDVCRSDIDLPVCSVESATDLEPMSPTISRTIIPTIRPTISSTAGHTTRPTSGHTTRPTAEHTTGPTAEDTTRPTVEHTTRPTAEHTTGPTAGHTTGPTAGHTTGPTAEHTTGPTLGHTTGPAAEHTTGPTAEHTTRPTARHTTTRSTASSAAGPTTIPTAKSTTRSVGRLTTIPSSTSATGLTASTTAGPLTTYFPRSAVRPTTIPTDKSTRRSSGYSFMRILIFERKATASSPASPTTIPTTSTTAGPFTSSFSRSAVTPIETSTIRSIEYSFKRLLIFGRKDTVRVRVNGDVHSAQNNTWRPPPLRSGDAHQEGQHLKSLIMFGNVRAQRAPHGLGRGSAQPQRQQTFADNIFGFLEKYLFKDGDSHPYR